MLTQNFVMWQVNHQTLQVLQNLASKSLNLAT